MHGLAGTASAAAAVASRGRDIIADLTDLEFTNCDGPSALPRVLRQVRHSGGVLVLAAPQQEVVRAQAPAPVPRARPLRGTGDPSPRIVGGRPDGRA